MFLSFFSFIVKMSVLGKLMNEMFLIFRSFHFFLDKSGRVNLEGNRRFFLRRVWNVDFDVIWKMFETLSNISSFSSFLIRLLGFLGEKPEDFFFNFVSFNEFNISSFSFLVRSETWIWSFF
jgi:hypothetical protein